MIIGNIDRGFAITANLGVIPTIGLYIKNYILDIGFGYGEIHSYVWADQTGSILSSGENKVYYPYIELGYSIPIKNNRY